MAGRKGLQMQSELNRPAMLAAAHGSAGELDECGHCGKPQSYAGEHAECVDCGDVTCDDCLVHGFYAPGWSNGDFHCPTCAIKRASPNDPSSPMTATQETLELPEPLAGQSLGAAPCSATVEKPHKVHVWVCGHYCGPYEFATAEEADADYEYRKGFRVIGCYYRRESPNAEPSGGAQQSL